jgi:urocanate hydratase
MAVVTAPRGVKAFRGTELRCKTWRAEVILRMLENNLENGEAPEELIIYAGTAKAARDWESYDRIVGALMRMEEDETLVMQSGKPIGLFKTHKLSPMVVMGSGAVLAVDRTSFYSEEVQALRDKGLTIMPGMTAAAWQYIGSQGILQGTYETFMAIGRDKFGGDLKGRMILTAGLGGMGGAQALAGYLAGAATLVVEADGRRVDRRIHDGYCQHRSDDLEEALGLVLGAKERGEPISVGLVANIAEVMPELLERDIVPEVVTDQTTTDFVRGYVPIGLSAEECDELRERGEVATLKERGAQTIAIHMRSMLEFGRRGSEIFEYGNGLRIQAKTSGVENAFEMGGFIDRYIRPLFCEGFGPFRWLAISGNPEDIYTIDDLILANFPGHPVCDWIKKAHDHVHFTGLPARIGWMGHGDRHRLGLLVNEAVRDGRITGPVSFTRDHLDSGSVTSPFRETENMKDGSDGIGDWPLLNGMLNAAAHADLIALHQFGGSAGVTVVADGTDQAAERLERVLQNDPGIGVLRHADAGYEKAIDAAKRKGLGLRVPKAEGHTLEDKSREISPRGAELRCKSWRAEAILRMLENNLANGEAPERLVIYSSTAKAARDWESFDAIRANLMELEEDETLVVQSGKPIGIFRTHKLSPKVVVANANVTGRWGTPEGFRGLVEQGLSMYGGMTAGAWQYIGSQGILQGTYETFAAIGRMRHGGTMQGRLIVTSGCGGMGGAQPLAGTLAGATVLICDVDESRIDRRIRESYLMEKAGSIDDAIDRALAAKEAGEAVSIGVVANAVELLETLVAREITPDVVTDQTATHLDGYVPRGLTPDQTAALRSSDIEELKRLDAETVAAHMRAMLTLGRAGSEIFEYGNGLRQQAEIAGVEDAFEMGGFIERYIRPLFCKGFGPFRWAATSGDEEDIAVIDQLILDNFPGHPVTDWIEKAHKHVKQNPKALPARIGWMGYGDRHRLGLLVNEAVRDGRLKGPVCFTRDHLDSGSVCAPTRETEKMKDGSDKIADWPLVNALLNVAGHADLVALHMHGGGRAGSAGVTVVADGTDQAAERIEAVLQNDPGIGVLRHADAGYEEAIENAARWGLGLREEVR